MAAHGVLVISQGPTGIAYQPPAVRPWFPRTVRGRLARSWATARRRWDERSETTRAALAVRAQERVRELIRRSAEAQRRYAEQVTATTEAYRPVAEVVSGRLAEAAARIERNQRRFEAVIARRREVAARPVWGYVLVTSDGTSTARAFRHDVAPDTEDGPHPGTPTDAGRNSDAMTAVELKNALLNLPDEPVVEWDPAAKRATVAELCPPDNPAWAFESWWSLLPAFRRNLGWDPGATSRYPHASTHHTSHGAHLTGGWSGGWSGSVHT